MRTRTTVLFTILCVSAQAATSLAPDRSLTSAQYRSAGFPPLEEAWGKAQASAAITSLLAIARSDVAALPRYRSPKSGAIFERLIDYPRIRLSETNKPPYEELVQQQGYLNTLFKLYLYEGIERGYTFDVEQAVLAEKLLNVTCQIYSVLNAQRDSGKNTHADNRRFEELQQLTPQFLLGANVPLADPTLEPQARMIYTQFLPTEGRRLAGYLSADQRAQLAMRVKPLLSKIKNQDDADKIMAILK